MCVGVCGKMKRKKEKKRDKKRDELECVGGVIRRKITRNGTVCTYGCGCCVDIDIDIVSIINNRLLCVCFVALFASCSTQYSAALLLK